MSNYAYMDFGLNLEEYNLYTKVLFPLIWSMLRREVSQDSIGVKIELESLIIHTSSYITSAAT